VRTLYIFFLAFVFLALSAPVGAALLDQVNTAFEEVHGRLPTFTEWKYWADRVLQGDKKTHAELTGAMGYHKAQGTVLAAVSASKPAASPPTASFKTDVRLYPSSINPNFLPEGTLVRSPSSPEVFYITGGKKSWVLSSILNRWLGENHFYKPDIITTISESDLARYPQTKSVNFLYIGKVLQHPNGTQFYIDDKLRKRELPASVRGALKFPATNLYPTTVAHLQEFATGTKITRTDLQPGGMAIYHGPWHGGTIWRVEEGAGGKLTKRLFLSDYLYEAYGYPDESQRVAVSATELARYERGPNIERYPDGWIVGLDGKIYVVQNGSLRLISSPELFTALGYKSKYVLTVFPEFLRKYPKGQPIGAFKAVIANNVVPAANLAPAPNTAYNLFKVRPAVRTLIAQINDIALPVYDAQISAAENKFWVDYVYHGEVATKEALVAAMKQAKTSGKKPALMSRTAVLSADTLKNKWFPYLFYFVHQQEPSEAAKDYWFGRIDSGDRNTIEKLGGTLQWLKDTSGTTHK
jgi:hypothetical protein